MPLIAGSRLGPYEIVALLGAGGMGEVYRARDTRLGRDVAIKVIAPAFATDAGRLARFELEARATATLNHPNILAVYDVGVEGQPYVVSEFLEGETLRTMLSRGALPPRTAVDVAIQIARGLAAAHEKGIVHRDLKPENGDDGLSSAATTYRSTMAGTVLGTVGYMAPEQVRGEPADLLADVFAFGAVAYEMLSGQRAFARGTAVETMTAVLNDEPPELAAPAGAAWRRIPGSASSRRATSRSRSRPCRVRPQPQRRWPSVHPRPGDGWQRLVSLSRLPEWRVRSSSSADRSWPPP